ncbi:MAG TPA: ABC transporter permease [Candidatus Lustribacter sp.]
MSQLTWTLAADVPAPARKPLRWKRALTRAGTPVLGLAVLFALWWAGGWLIAHDPRTAAFAGFAPGAALARLGSMLADGSIWRAFVPSMYRVAFGLALAIAVGVPVGIVIGRNAPVRAFTHTPFQLLRMISPLAWMPVAILVFPSWDEAIVFLIAGAAVWPVMFSTASGLRKLDPDWFKVAHNLGASLPHLLGSVVVPAIAQDILGGIRIALGIAWILLVPAEYLGVTSGLGYAINDARDTLEYDRLAALILVIGIIGFTLDSILLALIRRASWVRHD